ncbi:MAG: ABC transporter ATP-binding protein [Methylovirgula sp.]
MLALEKAAVRLDGTLIFSGIDLEISSPGVTSIMGPSGIGKTTLLRAIAGLVPLSDGQSRCEAKIAQVFQEPRLLAWQSAVDNAGFGLRAAGLSHAAARVEAERLLDRLGLSAADRAKNPSALSGGMRQRVALARALVMAPDLLLLDEPFSNLDPPLRDDLRSLLLSIVAERGIAAIVVTHDPIEAALVADRLVVLGGRPAQKRVDLALSPRPRNMAEAYAAAAAFMRRPEIAAAFARN